MTGSAQAVFRRVQLVPEANRRWGLQQLRKNAIYIDRLSWQEILDPELEAVRHG